MKLEIEMKKSLFLMAAMLAFAGTAASAKPLNLLVRTTVNYVPDQSEADDYSLCNAGEVAVGGGAQLGTGGIYPAYLTATKPLLNANNVPVGWDSVVTNTTGSTQPFTVYAVCQH
jgi:hypothetical protein